MAPEAAKKVDAPMKRYESGTLPEAPDTGDGDSPDFSPFLKVDHIPKRGKVKITFTGESRFNRGTTGKGKKGKGNRFGDQIICGVKMEGKAFDWGIRLESGNFRRIKDLWGNKIRKGGTVLVCRDSFEGRDGKMVPYIKILD